LTRADAQDWLAGVRERLGVAMVLITHDLEEALYLGDRVALLHARPGPLELLASPVATRAELTDGAARAERPARLGGTEEHADLVTAEPDREPEQVLPGRSRREVLTAGGAAALLAVPAVAGAVVSQRGAAPAESHGAAAAAPSVGPLQIGYLPITDASPLLLAHANGELAARGIDAGEPTLFRGWAPLVEALQGDRKSTRLNSSH